MNELIENVAKALYAHGTNADSDPYIGGWETMREKYKDTYRDSARVAIVALRKPTQTMFKVVSSNGFAGDFKNFESDWALAIDAALA